MRKSLSLSALGIAMVRAVESEKPPEERICFDPYARRFIPGWFYYPMRLLFKSGYVERRGPGVSCFLAARDRYIDDYLAGRLRAGFDQLVILGAGLDSRAYRFEGLCGRVRVFELDHPATQEPKVRRVREVLGQLPEHVTYVPIDFNQQSLAERLAAHGYEPGALTVFIWQGVTYYLDPQAVDGTLDFIARCSAPGSSVIFDYIDLSLLLHPAGHAEVRGMKRYRSLTGENPAFGIPAAEIEPFLTRRGFAQVHNIRSEELGSLYLQGGSRFRKVIAGYGIVSAAAAGKAGFPEGGRDERAIQ